MANYQSRYTGPEIDERLRKAVEAVLTEAQSLDADKQAQARENIGAESTAAVDGKYTKPSGDIPASDLASGVQASLGKADTAYQKPQAGIPADDLAPGVIPDVSQFITDDDLSAALEAKQDTISDLADIRSGSQDNVKYTQQTLTNAQKEEARSNIGAGTYDKPDGGIPESDLAQAVKDKLNATEIYPVTYGTTTQTQIAAAVAAGKLPVCKYGDNVYVYAGESSAGYSQFTSILYNTAARIYVKDSTWGNGNFEIYSKPSGGIPKSDLASGVQSSLAKADTALQEHQDISGKADKVSGATSGDFAGLDSNGNLTDSGSKASDFATAAQGAKADTAYQKPQDGIPASDLEAGVIPTVPVRDVTLDDISVLDGTTAKLPAYPKSPRIFMGTCSTAAATVAKEATVEAFPLDANNKPLVGTVVGIKFSHTNSATAPTLNVNSTGAASIWYNNAAYEGKGAYGGSASRYIYYVWDGTYWAFQGWSYDADADTNTIGYNLRTNGGTAVAAAKFYRYRLLFTAPDGQSLVPSNTSSSTSTTAAKTVNQAKIDPFGPIWYYSTTTAVAADAGVSASYLWMQYSAIPLGYAFNRTGAALTMTERYPVYLKCAPQSDGSAIMDADTPIVQALPSTEDGKIYIFLGYAESADKITLYYWHPVYYFKDGAIRQWSNAAAASITVDQTYDGTSANAQSGVAMAGALAGKQDTIDAQHKLDYGLLSNTPTIPAAQVNSDWNASNGVAQILNKPNLATVATSGSYDDLSNKPVVDATPTANSNNLVKSGGVFDAIEDVMEAVDGSNVETVTVLPTASASTVGKIYYVGPDGNGEYARYRGIESGGSYSFLPLGSTAMDLTDYATKEEVDNKWKLPDTQIMGFRQGYISTNGNYSTVVNASSNTRCRNIDVTPGQTYQIYGTSASSTWYRLYSLCKEDGTRVARADAGDYTSTPAVVVIPAGVVHMTINLYDYTEATDKVLLVGKNIDAQTLQAELDQTDEELSSLRYVAEEIAENKQASDPFAPMIIDWMPFSHWKAGQSSVAYMSVVSSTQDTLTLTAEEAATFTHPSPTVVGFSDGSYKLVYFAPYSGSGASVTRETFDSTDLTNAVSVQCLHDTVRGGSGIHLSASGYLGLAQYTAAELAKRMSQKYDNLITGANFAHCTSSAINAQTKMIVDTFGREICRIESSFADNDAIPGISNKAWFNINTTANQIYAYRGGWATNAYSMGSGGATQYNKLTFKASGRGFIELQAGLVDYTANFTGTAEADVYADGVLVETVTLKYIQTRFQIDNVSVKKTLELRLRNTSGNPTCIVVYSFNFWRMTPAVPVLSLTGKKIAVIGDSWTQFPGQSDAIPNHPFNENVVEPDGTTYQSYGYFPKELARVTGATVDNWGKGGQQAGTYGIPKIDQVLAYTDYDYVVIEFFINDFNANVPASTWLRNIQLMCNRCVARGARPIVIAPCLTNSAGYAGGSWHELIFRGLRALIQP